MNEKASDVFKYDNVSIVIFVRVAHRKFPGLIRLCTAVKSVCLNTHESVGFCVEPVSAQ